MTSDQRTSWRLYVVPRFLLNAGSLHGLKRKVGGSAEFAAIERKEDNRELMMLQEVIALDEQLLSRKPSWLSPVESITNWSIVGFDQSFPWSQLFPGHYYVIHQFPEMVRQVGREHIATRLNVLKERLGQMSGPEVSTLRKRWEGWLSDYETNPETASIIPTIATNE